MNLQGLILNKYPLQERHLIGSVLLRQGKKISLKFLGGRGGGKSQKGSILEPGAMIEFGLIGANKNQQRDLWLCKDWKSVW